MKKRSYRSGYGPQRVTPGLVTLVLVMVIVSQLIPVLLSSDASLTARLSLRKYKEGELCDEDVYAANSFEFIDTEKTRETVEAAQKDVLPVFSYSLNATLVSTSRMERFIAAWDDPVTAAENIAKMLSEYGIADTQHVVERYESLSADDRAQMLVATRETLQLLLQKGIGKQSDIAETLRDGYSKCQVEGMPSSAQGDATSPVVANLESLATKETMGGDIAQWMGVYSDSIKGFQILLLEDTMRLLISENVLYNPNVTDLRRTEAAESTPKIVVTVKKGERILTKNTVIEKSQIELLKQMSMYGSAFTVQEIIGRAIFALIVTISSLFVFLTFVPKLPRRYQYLRFACLMVALTSVASYFLYRMALASTYSFTDSVIPYIVAPLFVSLVSGKKRLGSVTAFLVSCYTVLLPGMSIMTFFICMINANICVFLLQHADKKIDNLFHWVYACIACLFTEISLSLLSGNSFVDLLPVLGALVANITLSFALVSLLLSIFENLFNLPTDARLDELAFTDNPLLDRLSASAQGTFNHSQNVAELAYEAAKAIGANAMLARVGGLYHDIGKMDYPEYFVENQGADNKQDDIKPSLSVAIIKSHVKTGIEKGREAGLPQEVVDIIATHQGDDVIYYFYRKAQDMAGDNPDLINKADYSYDGDVPDSKEAAIVMIADSVEAASRTVKKPSSQKYEKLIRGIIMTKIEHEQLGESQLSLTDLELIVKTLTKALVGRNHHRIEYPTEAKPDAPQTQPAEGQDETKANVPAGENSGEGN